MLFGGYWKNIYFCKEYSWNMHENAGNGYDRLTKSAGAMGKNIPKNNIYKPQKKIYNGTN